MESDELTEKASIINKSSTIEVCNDPESGMTKIIDEHNLIDLPDIEDDELIASGNGDIPPEDSVIIEQWWEQQNALERQHDSKGSVRLIEEFIEMHKRLMIHSGIEERLFSLEDELYRENRADDYFALLLKVKEQCPGFYMQHFGYFDYSLITYALQTGRFYPIQGYLDNFKKDPVTHVDRFSLIVDLLAWIGAEKQLKELVETTTGPILASDEILDDEFILKWYFLYLYVEELATKRPVSDIIATIIDKAKMKFKDDIEPSESYIRDTVEQLLNDTVEWNVTYTLPKEQIVDFFLSLKWHLAKYLKNHRTFGWVQACSIADNLAGYWLHYGTGKEEKNGVYLITESKLKSHMRRLEPINAICLPQGVWYFAEFLFHHEKIDTYTKKNLQDISVKRYDEYTRHIEPSNPITKVITEFPKMKSFGSVQS